MTELDTNEIVPSKKFEPMFRTAAAMNVSSSTGTSAYVCDVRTSTDTTTIATMMTMTPISCASVLDAVSPKVAETYMS